MRDVPEPDRSEEDGPTRARLSQRLLLLLPRIRPAREKAPVGERLRSAFLKPVDPGRSGAGKGTGQRPTVAELQAELRSADDKERLVGLVGAPVAVAVGSLVTASLIADHPRFLANGRVNPGYVDPSLYHGVTALLLALAVLMLAAAWFRKRLFLGVTMALYGLTLFNLQAWGFAIPFVMVAAWLIVRTYRLQRLLREATAGDGRRDHTTGAGRGQDRSRPRASKRYVPPAAPRRSAPPAAHGRRQGKRAG